MNVVENPRFELAENVPCVVGLGYTERLRTGNLLAESLWGLGCFSDISVVTSNELDGPWTRKLIRDYIRGAVVVSHSDALRRTPHALQVLAFDPPEQVRLDQLALRSLKIAGESDEFPHELGAHKIGLGDMVGAGLEICRSPLTNAKTPLAIAGGFSGVRRLIEGAEDFPEGRALVHGSEDSFGFADLARPHYEDARRAGVTVVELDGVYHNEILFAPEDIINQLTPAIFPTRS